MKRKAARNLGCQRGQSLVELAIMLPLLVTLLLGAVDFARVFYTQVAISNAARVGAEYAIDSRRDDAEIVEKVIEEAGSLVALTTDDVQVSRAASSWDASETDATINIQYRFTPIAPFTSRFWGGGDLTLRVSTTTRQVS